MTLLTLLSIIVLSCSLWDKADAFTVQGSIFPSSTTRWIATTAGRNNHKPPVCDDRKGALSHILPSSQWKNMISTPVRSFNTFHRTVDFYLDTDQIGGFTTAGWHSARSKVLDGVLKYLQHTVNSSRIISEEEEKGDSISWDVKVTSGHVKTCKQILEKVVEVQNQAGANHGNPQQELSWIEHLMRIVGNADDLKFHAQEKAFRQVVGGNFEFQQALKHFQVYGIIPLLVSGDYGKLTPGESNDIFNMMKRVEQTLLASYPEEAQYGLFKSIVEMCEKGKVANANIDVC